MDQTDGQPAQMRGKCFSHVAGDDVNGKGSGADKRENQGTGYALFPERKNRFECTHPGR